MQSKVDYEVNEDKEEEIEFLKREPVKQYQQAYMLYCSACTHPLCFDQLYSYTDKLFTSCCTIVF